MSPTVFHPSIEGAQHGAKSLEQFLAFAKASGAAGVQPSNYLLQEGSGLAKASAIRRLLDAHGLKLDGISAHCPFWVHTTAWTGSPTIKPFLPPEIASQSTQKIEAWCEDYLLRLMDLAVELDIKIIPMFWGVAAGWEVATGYPWGFWAGPGYDLLQEGKDRFVAKTRKLREAAGQRGLYLAHEIHPGTGAMTAAEFLNLVAICDGDPCLAVNADPSHCWEGESWETRFRAVAERVVACHVKNYVIRPGLPLRQATPGWPDRAMQFVDLPSGDLNLARYVEMLIHIDYPKRYCQITGAPTAPLVVEAESAYRDLDATSANGIAHVRDHLCFPLSQGSFEEGMGA
jgi:sugar phosphate isomerase/epimerase